MGWVLKALLFLVGLINLLKRSKGDDETQTRRAKEKWRQEEIKLKEKFDAAKQAYFESLARGDPNHDTYLHNWQLCQEALRRHRDTR